jgi:hypothetical protein
MRLLHESCQPDWRDSKVAEPENKFQMSSFCDFLKKVKIKKSFALGADLPL